MTPNQRSNYRVNSTKNVGCTIIHGRLCQRCGHRKKIEGGKVHPGGRLFTCASCKTQQAEGR